MRWHAPVLFLAPKNSESSAARQQKIHMRLELPNYKKGNSPQHKSDVGLLKKHTRHNDCDLYRQRHCVRYRVESGREKWPIYATPLQRLCCSAVNVSMPLPSTAICACPRSINRKVAGRLVSNFPEQRPNTGSATNAKFTANCN